MKRIELKKVSIVFLTMLLFLSIQIPAFAADTDTTVKIPVEQVFDSQNKDASDEFMYALLTERSRLTIQFVNTTAGGENCYRNIYRKIGRIYQLQGISGAFL